MTDSAIEKLLSRAEPVTESGRWIWMGCVDKKTGYGTVRFDGRQWRAHRLFYSILNGPVPSHLVCDHLCRVRSCVNPSHIDIVKQIVNVHRGVGITSQLVKQTHCKYGHELSSENLYVTKIRQRNCKKCRSRIKKAYRLRLKLKRRVAR